MQDISINIENKRFDFRARAVVVKNNKILTMWDKNKEYLYLPGGRVCIGQLSKNTLQREILEEMGLKSEVLNPIYVHEQLFKNDTYHEICIYYITNIPYIPLTNFEYKENESTLNEFVWLDIYKLKDHSNLYPKEIFEKISNLDFKKEIIIKE